VLTTLSVGLTRRCPAGPQARVRARGIRADRDVGFAGATATAIPSWTRR